MPGRVWCRALSRTWVELIHVLVLLWFGLLSALRQEHSDGQVCMIPDHVQNLATWYCESFQNANVLEGQTADAQSFSVEPRHHVHVYWLNDGSLSWRPAKNGWEWQCKWFNGLLRQIKWQHKWCNYDAFVNSAAFLQGRHFFVET